MTTVSVLSSPSSFQQLIDRARLSLKDDDKIRYPDDELMAYANLAMGIIKRRRPDLFYGSFVTALPAYVLADNYPLEEEYAQSLIDYLIARAETKNAEASDGGRAAQFFALFDSGLTN